ncbi:hypothetical protein WR25_27069 [Diploscapter pachys]|uniref:Caspase n=1 Tax=Diploscapter pachys TaxID=2018661 RepID=A0A2A2KCG2_9BILA|nr:hypothetical protein WR25_27069 [Diploscapter pachys]
MDSERRQVLDGCVRDCIGLRVDQVCGSLVQQNIFNDAIVEKIKAYSNVDERRMQLFKELKSRGNQAFDAFYVALHDTGQGKFCQFIETYVNDAVRIRSRSSVSSVSMLPVRVPLSPSFASTSNEPNWKDKLPPLGEEPEGLLNIEVDHIDGDSDQQQAMLMFERDRNIIYPNFADPKGLCLIINNENFRQMPRRVGTHVDRENMRQLFLKLGYYVQIEDDLTTMEMGMVMEKYAMNDLHRNAHSAVIIVLTHGEHEQLLGVNDDAISIYKFLDYLSPLKAPYLRGKPKIVFIQACRGEMRDLGVEHVDATDDGSGSLMPDWPSFKLPLPTCMRPIIERENPLLIPVEADIFIGYATPPYYVSWRNSLRGSWFIQAICQVFSKFARDQDLATLLTMVNQRVADSFQTNGAEAAYKQMPESTSR